MNKNNRIDSEDFNQLRNRPKVSMRNDNAANPGPQKKKKKKLG